MAITNILCYTKRWFAFSKIGFYASTKVFEEALNSVKILDRQSACKITNSNKTCNFNVVFFKKKTYQKLLQNAYIWRSDTTIEGYTRTLLHMPYVWWSHITISLDILELFTLTFCKVQKSRTDCFVDKSLSVFKYIWISRHSTLLLKLRSNSSLFKMKSYVLQMHEIPTIAQISFFPQINSI